MKMEQIRVAVCLLLTAGVGSQNQREAIWVSQIIPRIYNKNQVQLGLAS